MTAGSTRQMRSLLAIVAAAGLAAASAQPRPARQPAQSQEQPSGPPNALQGFTQNRNEPVKITSVALDVRDRNKVATFTGNVELVQGDTTMRCKTLVVYYDGDPMGGAAPAPAAPAGSAAGSQIRRMEAKGGVVVTQKDQTATGDSAIYDIKDNTVRLFPPAGGTVAVSQGQNIVRGPLLVVHLDTGVSHFEGGVEMHAVPQHPPASAAPAPGKPR